MVVYILSLPSLTLGVWERDIVQAVVDYASEVKYTEWLLISLYVLCNANKDRISVHQLELR